MPIPRLSLAREGAEQSLVPLGLASLHSLRLGTPSTTQVEKGVTQADFTSECALRALKDPWDLSMRPENLIHPKADPEYPQGRGIRTWQKVGVHSQIFYVSVRAAPWTKISLKWHWVNLVWMYLVRAEADPDSSELPAATWIRIPSEGTHWHTFAQWRNDRRQ
jgi:hypothetical protein